MLFGIPWQIVVLFSGALSSVSLTIGKHLVGKYSAFQIGFWRDLGAITIAIILFIAGGYGSPSNAILIVIYGFFVTFTVGAYLSANRDDFSGSTVFAYSMSTVFIVISSGFVFSEWVYFDPRGLQGLVNIAALVLTLVAFSIYSQGRKGQKIWWSSKILLSVFGNVAGNVFVKYMVNGGVAPAQFLLYQYVGMVAGGTVYVISRRKKVFLGLKDSALGLLQGLFMACGVLIYLFVLQSNPLSLANLVRRIATVLLTTSSGLFLFKESKSMDRRMRRSLFLGLIVFTLVLVVNR